LNAPITHLAILKYYTENIPIEETILNCNDLFEFCFTTKTGYTYDKTYQLCGDNKILINKVNRVVATTKKEFGTIYKYKNIDGKIRYDKIAEIPENCFIVNDSLEMIDHLDKQ
jgi:DNA polymerase